MEVDRFAHELESLVPEQALEAVLAASQSAHRCLTSSFQAEDMVVAHILRKRIPDVPVLFLDTGYHFPQTYEYRDRMIRQWDATTGDHIGSVPMAEANDPLAAYAGDRGAEVYRACVACHSLSPDQGPRAGPTLQGIFGRKIATLSGYNFSDALKQLDIVWTPETVSRLFELGPMQYTPGTKMPEQKITSADDRVALVEFLKKAATK